MNTRTAEVLAEIKRAAAEGQKYIAPSIFSFCYGRAATSAAFRIAKQNGVIEVAYTSCAGTPVYQAAGTKQAIVEAANAVKH